MMISKTPKITPKATHVTGFARVMFLLGHGDEPIAVYKRPNDGQDVYVFPWQARDTVQMYFEIRSQLGNIPRIEAPADAPTRRT
jgi:hypothetical protein